MGDTSPQWYFEFHKVIPECRGIGAIAYRDYEAGGHIIILSLWFWSFTAERCEPMRKGLRI